MFRRSCIEASVTLRLGIRRVCETVGHVPTKRRPIQQQQQQQHHLSPRAMGWLDLDGSISDMQTSVFLSCHIPLSQPLAALHARNTARLTTFTVSAWYKTCHHLASNTSFRFRDRSEKNTIPLRKISTTMDASSCSYSSGSRCSGPIAAAGEAESVQTSLRRTPALRRRISRV